MSSAIGIEPSRNLGTAERDKRLRHGVLGAAISLAGAVALVSTDVGWAYRLLLFVPFLWSANLVATGLLGT